MSLETVTQDLNYYKPLLQKYSKLKKHVLINTDPSIFQEAVVRWKMQKEYGISNFITFIVIEYMRGKDYIDSHNEDQRAEIEFYTTRRLQ